MNYARITPVLLALLLTGCAAVQPPQEQTEETLAQITEPETTAAPETAETPAAAEEMTPAPETEPETETEQVAQMLPAEEQEKAAYRFIREELAPVYGLSDTAFFEVVDWDQSIAVPPPADTQGIVSAYIYDFTGDGNAELLTIRESGYEFIADLYTPVQDSFSLLGTQTIAEYGEMTDASPMVSVQGNALLVRTNFAAVPGYSHYGTTVTAYAISDSGIRQLAEATGYRAPGFVSITINDDTYTADEGADDLDYAGLCDTIRQTFQNAGVDCGEVNAGWGFGNEYGIEIGFPSEISLFMVDYVPDSGSFFLDDTGLRERINVE